MAVPILSDPVVLRFAGNIPSQTCAQAVSAGDKSLVLLQPIDYSGKNLLQQWQFGSDGRIYLYNASTPAQFCLTYLGEPENGAPLALGAPDPTDQTQVWQWVNNLFLKNKGASQSGTNFVMDDFEGKANPGNKLEIWPFNNGSAQYWIAQAVLGSQLAAMSAQTTAA